MRHGVMACGAVVLAAAAAAAAVYALREGRRQSEKLRRELERLRGELIEHYADNEEDIEALQGNMALVMEDLDLTH